MNSYSHDLPQHLNLFDMLALEIVHAIILLLIGILGFVKFCLACSLEK